MGRSLLLDSLLDLRRLCSQSKVVVITLCDRWLGGKSDSPTRVLQSVDSVIVLRTLLINACLWKIGKGWVIEALWYRARCVYDRSADLWAFWLLRDLLVFLWRLLLVLRRLVFGASPEETLEPSGKISRLTDC